MSEMTYPVPDDILAVSERTRPALATELAAAAVLVGACATLAAANRVIGLSHEDIPDARLPWPLRRREPKHRDPRPGPTPPPRHPGRPGNHRKFIPGGKPPPDDPELYPERRRDL